MMEQEICILDIVHDTIVDGTGFRTVVYSAGCPHACPGCHNPQSWDRANGRLVSIDAIMEEICRNPVANVTFSGGEPFMQARSFIALAKKIKSETNKTIWCYTGFTYETLLQNPLFTEFLSYIDVLVDGRFDETQQDPSLHFRGSRNQRIIELRGLLKEVAS